MMKFKHRETTCGISITDSGVRVALVQRVGEEIRLLNTANLVFQKGLVSKGMVLDMEEAAGILQQGLSFPDMQGLQAHLSVPLAKTFMRRLTLQNGTDEEIRSQIDVEIHSWPYLPFQSFVFDYIPLNRSEDGQGARWFRARAKELDVLVFVTSSELVEQYIKLAKEAGFKPGSVELGPMALHRTLHFLHQTGKWGLDEDYALLHIEADEVSLSIFEHGLPMFMQAISMNTTDSELELESYYQFHSSQMLSAEITRMLSFYQQSQAEEHGLYRKLYLSGDIKRVQVIAGCMEKNYLGEITILPFHLLLSEEQEAPYDYAVAVGLAMKGV